MLPPLTEIEDTSCICLACVKVIDGLIAQLDNARSLQPVRTIAKRRRKVSSSTSAPLVTPLVQQSTQLRIPSLTALQPQPQPQPHTYVSDVEHAVPYSHETHLPTAIATATHEHPQPPVLSSVSEPVPEPAPPLPPVPDGVCVLCYLSSSGGDDVSGVGGSTNGANNIGVTGEEGATTLGELYTEITAQVGTHLSTLETAVRNFRAARVELAEGVCPFDSRAFTAALTSTDVPNHAMAVCHMHREALVQAAASKAAGALACAVCGDKPTLRGAEEVRCLATPRLLNTPDHRLFAALVRFMHPSTQPDDDITSPPAARSFIEKEYACMKCVQLLENHS